MTKRNTQSEYEGKGTSSPLNQQGNRYVNGGSGDLTGEVSGSINDSSSRSQNANGINATNINTNTNGNTDTNTSTSTDTNTNTNTSTNTQSTDTHPNESLQLPQIPSTPQARRKRGLSLRSQLFNKALTTRLINPSLFELDHSKQPKASDAIEMENMTNQSQSPTPQITIDEPPKKQSNIHPSFFRSPSNVSSDSINSDTSSIEFLNQPHKRKGKSKFVKFWNRITGNVTLPPTENGRLIPLTVSGTCQSEWGSDYYIQGSDLLIDERNGETYCSNAITSSKYTVYSFLPKQLKAQFSKVANCYFLIVAIMQMIPSWSTTGQYTTIIPLSIFISISMGREAFDDWKRHGHDREENSRSCVLIKESRFSIDSEPSTASNRSLSSNGSIEINGSTEMFGTGTADLNDTVTPDSSHDTHSLNSQNLCEIKSKWKHIKVGDIIKMKEDEWVPADILLISAYNQTEPHTAYIETMDLDGETNLKSKFAPVDISNTLSTASGLKTFNKLVTVEDPNTDLYNFEGLMNLNEENVPLGPDNIIYRGSIIRNTKSILGLVIFTGEETKIRMNNIKNPRTKAPKLQKNINYIVIFMVFVVASLSAFSLMAQKIMYQQNRNKAWYLYHQDVGTAATLMGFIIMYNTLIPLSLYVTMEIIKVGQLVLLQVDIDMYHKESNTPADAKTATILEELGQVSYIFSDKTGTLTDNKMLFRKFSVNGVSWIHDLDVDRTDEGDGRNSSTATPSANTASPSIGSRKSTTSIVRESMDLKSIKSSSTWKSTSNPSKPQTSTTSLSLLKYLQTNPNTLFAKKANFFLLSIALCSTCLPRHKNPMTEKVDQDISYQASSPDEKALIEAARDLGYVVFDRKTNTLTLKTYPKGFKNPPKYDHYQVLDVIEFSSSRKRMSIVVKFPDNRIAIICKGADNVIIDKLKNTDLAKKIAREITLNAAERKQMEADVVLQERFSQEAEREARASMGSLNSIRKSLHLSGVDKTGTMKSIDDYLSGNEDTEVNDVAERARVSLHLQQKQRYSLEEKGHTKEDQHLMFSDRLVLNEEYVIEKTLEHIEDFSVEGLRTLLYSFKWLTKSEYEEFSTKYQEAKTSLVDRAKQVEIVGESIEKDLELLGATAIEDKLQEGVAEAIEKLRRAGIKMWMLTGDKRETAINIGYSCRLIKDYSTVVVLNIDESKEEVRKKIVSTTKKIKGGSIAHGVVVIDGATLGAIQDDEALMYTFIDLCVVSDSAICCRASPAQKASMVSAIRDLDKKSVTLAIGDGANDIAMIQSADIGVGITGKEGLQAARASDYAIAQFRFLLKLLLVNGRYNYVRTSKFVLCTFYKELIFYLTQACYQRHTLFSGSSVYESWSLSMFNTLFTSLPVLVVGIFDKDLKPATLLAVPELYAKGRLYQGFNLKIFVWWMVLAASQSVSISFLSWYIWAEKALRDNTTLPLGTLLFATLVIIINIKCMFIETQNRTWLSFVAFVISVGGYGVFNAVIMLLYRSRPASIFYVDYGLLEFGQDVTWWAALLVLSTFPLLLDIFIQVFKYIIKPSDSSLFQAMEKDMGLRRMFEQRAYNELKQGWESPKQRSSWYKRLQKWGIIKIAEDPVVGHVTGVTGTEQRKRAGTVANVNELPAGGEGEVITGQYDVYDVLPSGKRYRRKRGKSILDRFTKEDEDIEAIISDRLDNLG